MKKQPEAFIDAFSEWTGRIIAWLVPAMMLLTCLIVLLRYQFDLGSVALQEIVVYMHSIVLLLGIAYTLRQDAHVRVDLLYSRVGETARAWINLLGTLVFLFPTAGFILLVSFDYVAFSYRLGEGSAEPGGLPGLYLLKSMILFMALGLGLQGVSICMASLRQLRRGGQD